MASSHGVTLAILPVTIILMYSSAIYGFKTCGEPGWFGDHCQYQCHCAGSADCDKVDGTCALGCDHGWFGPACQYESVSYKAFTGGRTILGWLMDNDINTCNSGNTSFVIVNLVSPTSLSWVRLVMRNSANLNEITLGYRENGNDRTCSDQGKAKVNKNTVDVNCSSTHAVSELSLTGPGVKSLCSLYVNGGRNLALKQYTNMGYESCTESAVVDGILDNRCIHLDYHDWTLTFYRPVRVTRILLYNFRYSVGVRPYGRFTLAAIPSRYYENMPDPYNYTDPGGPGQDVYTVIPAPRINFDVISIVLGLPSDGANVILTLCEASVFGETSCTRRFGMGCEQECNCADPTESCFVHSGGCPTGCAHGYTGEDCWTKIECNATTWGEDCLNCSSQCLDKDCDNVTGVCNNCVPGYHVDWCDQECNATRWGEDCILTCSSQCLDKDCDAVTGMCKDCVPGYHGDWCDQECNATTWGEDCGLNCSSLCLDKDCDAVTGMCKACVSGYHGDLCDQAEPLQDEGGGGSIIPVIVGSLVALLGIFAITTAVLLWRERFFFFFFVLPVNIVDHNV